MGEKKLQFIDLRGVGNSGKSAIGDVLSEFSNVFTLPYNVEFELFRAPGGLNDLYYHLCLEWTESGTDIAIKMFKKLMNRIGTEAKVFSPASMFIASGHNYDRLFRKAFFKCSNDFLKNIVQYEYQCAWPFDRFINNPMLNFYERIKNRLFPRLKTISTVYVAKNENIANDIYQYLVDLFSQIIPAHCDTVVLNNAFISPSLIDAVAQFKSIVVLRDPRDMYICSKRYLNGIDKNRNPTDIFSVNNIDNFIALKKKGFSKTPHGDKYLILQFEDLIYNYESTLTRLIEYSGLRSDAHIDKKVKFDPEKSRHNTQLWNKNTDIAAICKIEAQLGEYCLPNAYYLRK